MVSKGDHMARKDTEAEILRAATKVFLKKGFHGARTQEIADAAGINKALLHYYFKTKEQLFSRILEDALRTIMRQLHGLLASEGDIRDILRRVIDSYLDHLHRNSALAKFLLWELEHGGKTAARVLREEIITDDMEKLPFWATFQSAVERGIVRPLSPFHLILNLISMCIYPFVAAPIVERVFGVKLGDPEFIAIRKEVIFDCLWRWIEGPNANPEESA
jgi:TetR/AcrR family transcriptional regulator